MILLIKPDCENLVAAFLLHNPYVMTQSILHMTPNFTIPRITCDLNLYLFV